MNETDMTHQTEHTRPRGGQVQGELQIIDDLTDYLQKYARERPQTAALICLGVGFILGWKLKPW
jgi:hypothetical protein